MQEIRKHNKEDDCWLVSHGKVYDVTPMIRLHPGDIGAILRHGGQDSTIDFDFHGKRARKLWDKYLIGRLEGYANPMCSIQ